MWWFSVGKSSLILAPSGHLIQPKTSSQKPNWTAAVVDLCMQPMAISGMRELARRDDSSVHLHSQSLQDTRTVLTLVDGAHDLAATISAEFVASRVE
ncbi:unnamed protein product [Litomosoides sigmodontis]|uniref:Uncharacterized protein n=1 Tax=Litomosoides sigmodontis TaxID=42156 RepID=A0A3P6SWX2_LITSI|nr:unnamed protein product [Litomosoides sigmodontis]VDK83585.1 unnamed protein product [Litomosoides sigmodontis]VDK83945.1 unnamed protein product [Litomosoides sigmodontis]